MRIFNEDKTIELNNIDETKGYLKADKILLNHIDKVDEQGHYETIKEYANGGKDIAYIIDKPAVEEQDIYEDIKIFIPYTNDELNLIEINNLKGWYENYYSQQEQKLRRLHTLGKLTDEGKDPYNDLISLYNEAEIKRARIHELEVLINDSSK